MVDADEKTGLPRTDVGAVNFVQITGKRETSLCLDKADLVNSDTRDEAGSLPDFTANR